MRFSEFGFGTSVFINVRGLIENKQTGVKTAKGVSLSSFILDEETLSDEVLSEIPSGYRACSNIKVNGYIITFDNKGVDISIIVCSGNKNYKFTSCDIETIKVNKRRYLIVRADGDGLEFNLRSAFRIRLESPGNVAIEQSKVQHSCMIKDISSTGLCIEVETEYGIEIGNTLEIQFKMEVKGKMREEFNMYTIKAKVVRTAYLNDTKTGYGCIFTKRDSSIDRMIAQKQREELQSLVG